MPVAADSLTDSIGLNAPIPTSAPSSEVSALEGALHTLAVRHLRIGIQNVNATYDSAVSGFLTASNAKLDGITDCPGIEYDTASPTDSTQIQAFNTAIGSRLEDVEGPDEVDIRNDANWVSDTLACLPDLRKAEPSLPFFAPTVADVINDAPKLGNVSSEVDYGNMHRYFSGFNPGNTGWGGNFPCGTYGALIWAMCEARINGGSKPIVITETGYNSASEVDEATQAKYLSRLLFVNLQAGISRSYLYDLVDTSSTDGFGGDGLIREDYSAKPSFMAIVNLVTAFSDPGQKVAEIPLHYSITGASNAIRHLLLRKRTGAYMLVLWNESESWNVNAKKEITIAAQTVTVTPGTSTTSVSAESLNDTGAFAATPVSVHGNAMTLPVDDHVTVLTFKA